ncbi:imm11 family protein [Myxococcus sp. 1LA]
MYYVIRYGPAEDNSADLYMDPIPGKKVSFTRGERLGTIPLLTFRKRAGDRGAFLDYMGSSPPCMVVSDRFVEALRSVGVDNVDFYPAQLVDEASGKVTPGYQAANVVGLIACVDAAQSVYTLMPGLPEGRGIPKNGIFEFKSMHLDYTKVHGAKIFRLFETTSTIIVHESVRDAIEKAGLRGIRLIPAEGLDAFY